MGHPAQHVVGVHVFAKMTGERELVAGHESTAITVAAHGEGRMLEFLQPYRGYAISGALCLVATGIFIDLHAARTALFFGKQLGTGCLEIEVFRGKRLRHRLLLEGPSVDDVEFVLAA
jgi:hypothetical protein